MRKIKSCLFYLTYDFIFQNTVFSVGIKMESISFHLTNILFQNFEMFGFWKSRAIFSSFLVCSLSYLWGGGGRGIDCSMWSFHFGEDLYPVFQSLCPKYACGSTICNRTIWIKMRERFLKVYLKSRILVPILLDNSRVIWHLGLPFAHLHPQSLAIKKLRNMRKPVENSFNSYTVEINPCHYILYYRD